MSPWSVVDEYQGQGISGALMRHLVAITREAGFETRLICYGTYYAMLGAIDVDRPKCPAALCTRLHEEDR
jgi:predicted N-acetyltransferase YhbS